MKSIFLLSFLYLSLFAELPSANQNGLFPAVNIGGTSRNDATSNSNFHSTTGCEDSDKIYYFGEQSANKVASEVSERFYDRDAVHYDVLDCYQNISLNKLTIPMKIYFMGGKYYDRYWLRGNLEVDIDGKNGYFLVSRFSSNINKLYRGKISVGRLKLP